MATVKGNNTTLQYKAESGGAPANLSGYADLVGITSASISLSNATYETQSKVVTAPTSGAAPVLTPTRSYSVGTTTSTLSVEGVYDPALDQNADELFTLCKDKTRIGVFWVGDQTASGKAVGGVGFCTSFELSAGTDDFTTFSASFELTGDPIILAAA